MNTDKKPKSKQDTSNLITEHLATIREVPVAKIRAEIRAAGGDARLDSLESIEILDVLAEQFGFEIPTDEETAKSLVLLSTFTERLWQLVSEEES